MSPYQAHRSASPNAHGSRGGFSPRDRFGGYGGYGAGHSPYGRQFGPRNGFMDRNRFNPSDPYNPRNRDLNPAQGRYSSPYQRFGPGNRPFSPQANRYNRPEIGPTYDTNGSPTSPRFGKSQTGTNPDRTRRFSNFDGNSRHGRVGSQDFAQPGKRFFDGNPSQNPKAQTSAKIPPSQNQPNVTNANNVNRA
jgi:hypothetical protein